MHTEGGEVHESTDEARAGSTPNVVRWVLAISLLAAIVLLSIVWMTGAASTDGADDTNNATDRIRQEAAMRPSDQTDSIVSDDSQFQAAPVQPANPMNEAAPQADTPAPSPTPE